MLYENTGLGKALGENRLPSALIDLFGDLYDPLNARFLMQETTIIDFKEEVPSNFSGSYGAGILRLAIAFYNTYGGFIVFGVVDRTFTPIKTADIFNIEAFNRCLSDFTGRQIECSFRRYPTNHDENDLAVQVVLVPPRKFEKPARLTKSLDKYPLNTLWVRDRHEVLEATSRHLSLLYSDRSRYLQATDTPSTIVHRSLPPSPATLEEFVGRFSLMNDLWEWLTFGNQPRIYLHGPGGSGKSTLAYEFANSVADAALPIRTRGQNTVDYVIFLSAKETAFSPMDRTARRFEQRDFNTATEQFAQILFHSGMVSEAEIAGLSEDEIERRLDELFENFTGVIVIDDIDALSRRSVDTGEEALFIKAAQAGGRVKIIYTLRYAPPYALNSAREVPSLNFSTEFHTFVGICCTQFDVSPPVEGVTIELFEQSAGLPLLIETIIGLRRTCSTYNDAFASYRAREGDVARRYLYQREYDRLETRSKSRQVLAALSLINSPVTFNTIANVTSLSQSQVRDAITETKGIFLRTSEAAGGDTLYDVTTPSLAYLQQVSKNLPYYPALEKAVQHFKQEAVRTSTGDAAILFQLKRLAREGNFERIVEEARAISSNNTIWGNPRFLGLLGQGYSARGGTSAEDARECFRRAFALHDRDIFMLRSWYRLEFMAPHTIDNAERLCNDVLATEGLPPRYRSEFLSKLGQVLEVQSRSHVYTNRERAITLMKRSLAAYFDGAWLSRSVNQLDAGLQNEWLTQATGKLFRMLGNDLEPLFQFVETLPSTGHDVDMEAATILIEPLRRLRSIIGHAEKARLIGLANRTAAKLLKSPKHLIAEPGFSYVLQSLQEISKS
ncbi:AAA family ATPase [Mesorhizobium sp. CA18]|uniref:AAA family ATPase n=1 Tax=unclassified Mesorhizobium TaxID=325217 RepID=UPI001CCA83C0|nr:MULTISPECIES: AAA family ATPase [unclassified Mesorhizobium]MBZ9732232.1 AAA family ATPase [Mesorhizobium sp. CA9]MBZ9823670.1 AAA family ATPase [Mesorhizobium sp. CA18]MBZ9836004.1 AAA family ATPase [Mesorhizobium sp. CA3]MBZ9875312.1 AAA family ATPase [Mesorhizobium sp. Ca11]MBZ9902801.1 AAA family ATPase [Mesorhizobium sp. CA17]